MKRKLAEIAHCRAGDKGDTLTLSLFPLAEEDYPLLLEQVTAAAVKAHLDRLVSGDVRRYELPNLCALHFVCEHALETDITASLALDPHGRTLSYALLAMEIEAPPSPRGGSADSAPSTP